MRILLTGVHGFIGSHLARHLLDGGHTVVGVARSFSSFGQARIASLLDNRSFSLIYRDLAGDMSGLTERADVVLHLAAKTFVDHSIRDPATFVRNNVVASFNLMHDALIHKVPRFVLMSTDEVYGPILQGRYDEEAPLRPSNPYAATKGAADLIAQSLFTSKKLPVIIARASNVYGAWQYPQKAIPTFVRAALRDRRLPIYGDGSHRRAWISVEDVCRALALLIDQGSLGQIYHIASEDEVTNLELGETILRLLGRPSHRVEYIAEEDARPGHDRRYALETEKLRRLGWGTTSTLQTNLEPVVDWYARNSWWLDL